MQKDSFLATQATNFPVPNKKISRQLNAGMVLEIAEELDIEVVVSTSGKYSMSLSVIGYLGQINDTVQVNCSGNTYWIVYQGHDLTKRPLKWCMPRNEVAGDRADKFLVEVLKNYEECGIDGAIGQCLGINPLASIGYTRDVMYKRRQDKEKAQPIQLEHN